MSKTFFMGTHLPTIRAGASIMIDVVSKINPEAEITINPTEKKITLQTVEPTTADSTLLKLMITPTTLTTIFPVTITPEMTGYPITTSIEVESTKKTEWRSPVYGIGIGLPVEVVASL